MVDSNKITATDGRMRTVFDTVVNSSIKNYGVEEKIKEAVDKTSVRTGVRNFILILINLRLN